MSVSDCSIQSGFASSSEAHLAQRGASRVNNSRWFYRLKNGRPCKGETYVPTSFEHAANVLTHGLAVIPAILATRDLLMDSDNFHERLNATIYGVAYVFLFAMSSAYHSVFFWGKYKALKFYLQLVDRATIYIFIAASYAPWINLREVDLFGQCMRWIIWPMALFGTLFQIKFCERYKMIEIISYLFMGLFPAITIYSMKDVSGLMLLSLGGLIYIVGVVVFKLDGILPFAHAIWHLHVVAAASLHFYAVRTYLIVSSATRAAEAMNGAATNELFSEPPEKEL